MLRFLKRLFLFVALPGVALAIAAAIVIFPKYREFQAVADGVDLAELNRIPAISEVFDGAGQRYGRLEGEVRYVVPLAQISPFFIKALLAREDSRFYDHHGVDFSGILRAAVRNLRDGGVKEGASTITQQLARNTYDLGSDRWRRKAVEALLALRIERNFSKEQILEAYANRIYFGIGTYGIETAARACFGKSASDLTLSEAAILAGLIRSPNRLSPLKDSATALAERNQVLARMEELAMITPAEAAAARAESVPAGKQQPPRVQANYAMDAIMRDLEILIPKSTLDQGGLKIYTTIDRRLQLLAETALEARLAAMESEKGWPHPTRAASLAAVKEPGAAPSTESPYVQGALVAIDNETGGVLAVVGGRDFKTSPYNRALLSKRQVGSTFKPFIYAAAFARGLTPETPIDDSPIREGEVTGLASVWTPENSDGDNLGWQPASEGLVRSRNTMTIRVGEFASRGAVRDLAARAGLGSLPDIPSIYLGAFGATLKDVTAAYTMFPNGGVRPQPFIIDHIVDRNGRTIYRATRARLACLPRGVNYVTNAILRDVMTRGTAASAGSLGLTVPAAGKTGTTDDYKDAWFVGYTTRLTCGVWVGMDHPARIANRGYGSKLALPVWVDFVEQASEHKYVAGDFPVPTAAPVPAPASSPSPAAAVPVARAIPVTAPANPASMPAARAIPVNPAPPSGGNYQVTRTENGLQIDYGD
ncbi:MAG TPA: PBP1A family penicillin-binding protein [Chthoniobacterales bacterium]